MSAFDLDSPPLKIIAPESISTGSPGLYILISHILVNILILCWVKDKNYFNLYGFKMMIRTLRTSHNLMSLSSSFSRIYFKKLRSSGATDAMLEWWQYRSDTIGSSSVFGRRFWRHAILPFVNLRLPISGSWYSPCFSTTVPLATYNILSYICP